MAHEGPWVAVTRDHVAQLKSYSSLMAMEDVAGKGSNKLLVGCLGMQKPDNKLKTWHGSGMVDSSQLLDVPTAIVTLRLTDGATMPVVAVASGSNVFVFKNMRPYYNYSLPTLEVDPKEADIWKAVSEDSSVEFDHSTFAKSLLRLKQNGVQLSSRSVEYLGLPDDKQQSFINIFKSAPLTKQTSVTAMATIYKAVNEPHATSYIVICTEASQMLVLNTAFAVVAKWDLPSPATMISVSGQFDVEYRIVVACRDGNVYTIKGGSVSSHVIELPSHPVGLVRLNKLIYIGCMDETLYCYSTKGRKMWSLRLQSPIQTMTPVHYRPKGLKAIAIGLESGEVHLYLDKLLLSTLRFNGPISGLVFGKYGIDEGCLAVVTRGGELHIHALRQHVDLRATPEEQGPPVEQSIRINVPFKTQLYIDQTAREQNNYLKMHQSFQRDLYLLRLSAARQYAKTLDTSMAPQTTSLKYSLKLNAEVHGIGPTFKLLLFLKNTGETALGGISATFLWDSAIYSLEAPRIQAPQLIPAVEYTLSCFVQCLTEEAISAPITVYISNRSSPVPLITALVNMPVSEGLATVR